MAKKKFYDLLRKSLQDALNAEKLPFKFTGEFDEKGRPIAYGLYGDGDADGYLYALPPIIPTFEKYAEDISKSYEDGYHGLPTVCQYCLKPIPKHARPEKIYCSRKCKELVTQKLRRSRSRSK